MEIHGGEVRGMTGRDAAPEARAHREDALARLTPTQIKVLRGVHSGYLNKQIAFELGISEVTVKLHRSSVMRKMEAGSVGELIRAWERLPAELHARAT